MSFFVLLIGCLVVITYVPALSMSLVRFVEETGTVEVAWAEREAGQSGAGQGELVWRRRDPATESDDADKGLAPGAAAWPSPVAELQLQYGPDDRNQAAALAKGEAPVPCHFRLKSDSGAKIDVAWKAPVRRLEELGGSEHAVEAISILPPDSPLPSLGIGPESWTEAARVVIESATNGRIRGAVRGVVLYFPADEDLPPEIYDLELHFEAPAELDTVEPRELPAGAQRLEVPDVRLLVRRPEGAEGVARTTFLLERTRPMPWEIGTVWVVDVADVSELAGREIPLDSLRLAMANEPELPSTAKKKDLLRAARLKIDEVEGEEVAGRIQAVVVSEDGNRTFDVEIRFRLPARKKAD